MSEEQTSLIEENSELEALAHQATEAENKPISKTETEAAEKQAAEEKAGSEQAAALMMGAVKMGCGMFAPYVVINEQQETDVIKSCAPLFEKYGLHMGGAWAVEIKAALALAALGGGIYVQMKAHEMAKLEKQEKANAEKREPEAA